MGTHYRSFSSHAPPDRIQPTRDTERPLDTIESPQVSLAIAYETAPATIAYSMTLEKKSFRTGPSLDPPRLPQDLALMPNGADIYLNGAGSVSRLYLSNRS